MIYDRPAPEESVDQADLVDGCPTLSILNFDPTDLSKVEIKPVFHRVVVLTQTCDLANSKVTSVNIAEVFDAHSLIDQGVFKPADVKGPLRAGRVWGMYFLPACEPLGLGEMIIDLRRLHTVRLDVLNGLCHGGGRRARLRSPYREHLAKHFADTFSRIGLPQPYETL